MSNTHSFSDTNVLCIYGVKDGKPYYEWKDWLDEKEERYLVFFEEEKESYSSLIATGILSDVKVRYFLLTKETEEEIFKQVGWEFVFLNFSYLNLKDKTRGEEIFAKMRHYQSGIRLLASDYSDFGSKVLGNLKVNVEKLSASKRGDLFWGKFTNVPAIICGAGPSLSNCLSEVKKLENRALLFAGGATLNVLSKNSIVPHFCANIDPDPPYERFLEQSLFEVPFFYQTRLSKKILQAVHAPLLWMSSSGGYPIENWVNEKAELDGDAFDGGWNVATFCLSIAAKMGCNPIILVGMDLCSSQGKLYAEGVEEQMYKEGLVKVLDKNGNTVYSKPDWVMAGEWISSFAAEHKDIKMINATDGGIPIKALVNKDLSSAVKEHLSNYFDLRGRIHSLMQEASSIGKGGTQAFKDAEVSLKRCEEICKNLLDAFMQRNPIGARLELELEEEIAHQKILSPLWNIWKYVFLRHIKDNENGMSIDLNKWLFFQRALKELQDATEI